MVPLTIGEKKEREDVVPGKIKEEDAYVVFDTPSKHTTGIPSVTPKMRLGGGGGCDNEYSNGTANRKKGKGSGFWKFFRFLAIFLFFLFFFLIINQAVREETEERVYFRTIRQYFIFYVYGGVETEDSHNESIKKFNELDRKTDEDKRKDDHGSISIDDSSERKEFSKCKKGDHYKPDSCNRCNCLDNGNGYFCTKMYCGENNFIDNI